MRLPSTGMMFLPVPSACWRDILKTKMPKNHTNQADYLSVHYETYDFNVLAICDPDLLFLCIVVAGSGKINKSWAFLHLCDYRIRCLWCFISVDCAYGLTLRVMIPINVAELLGECHRTYNFYLSQLRICIEMAFGLLMMKWRNLINS